MTWEAVSAVGTVFTAVIVMITAFVGIGQLRQFRGQRRDEAAVELVRSIQDDSFLRAYRLVFSLPPNATAAELAEAGQDIEDAALLLAFRFEMIAVLVHRGAIPFDIVEDLGGGLILGTWTRFKDAVAKRRELLTWPTYLEWFQWLAERFEQRDRLHQPPAFIRSKDWHPHR